MKSKFGRRVRSRIWSCNFLGHKVHKVKNLLSLSELKCNQPPIFPAILDITARCPSPASKKCRNTNLFMLIKEKTLSSNSCLSTSGSISCHNALCERPAFETRTSNCNN